MVWTPQAFSRTDPWAEIFIAVLAAYKFHCPLLHLKRTLHIRTSSPQLFHLFHLFHLLFPAFQYMLSRLWLSFVSGCLLAADVEDDEHNFYV